MQVEAALLFETTGQIYARVFQYFRPRTAVPRISIEYKKYANPDSRISLTDGALRVQISDMLEGAPAPVQRSRAFSSENYIAGNRTIAPLRSTAGI